MQQIDNNYLKNKFFFTFTLPIFTYNNNLPCVPAKFSAAAEVYWDMELLP